MIEFHLNYTTKDVKTTEEVISTSDYMEARGWMYDIVEAAAEHMDYNPFALRLEAISGSSRIVKEYGWTDEMTVRAKIREDIRTIIDLFII